MSIVFCYKFSNRFEKAIRKELEDGIVGLETDIPGYVSVEDILRWYKEGKIMAIPGLGRFTVYRAFRVIREEKLKE